MQQLWVEARLRADTDIEDIPLRRYDAFGWNLYCDDVVRFMQSSDSQMFHIVAVDRSIE